MEIIIGKIKETDGEKLEAVKLFDTENKTMQIRSCKSVKDRVMHGEIIKGYRKSQSTNYLRGKQKAIIVQDKNSFNLKKVPELNGKGQLINEEDARFVTIINWQGFAEDKVYICIDYTGAEKVYSITEFDEKVIKGEVNGAFFNKDKNKIVISKDLNRERVAIK
jgi:hypothetical protein